MGKSFVNAALKNQTVLHTIGLIVQAELEDHTAKLREKETKLKSVEEENLQLVIKLGKLQLYLETADEVQKKCREEIIRLKNELQKSIQNLEEKENAFKALGKHCSEAIGDYMAESMVLKKCVAEKQAELDISSKKIDTLEQRVGKLEKLMETKATENLRLKREIEEINSRQPEVGSRSGCKRTRSSDPIKSTPSVSLNALSNEPRSPRPPTPEREVSIKLTRLSLSPSVGPTKNVESCQTSQKAVAIPGKYNHGDAKKYIFQNGRKRYFCKCGLSFSGLLNLNRHIRQKVNAKNRNPNSASNERIRKANKTTSHVISRSKTGSRTVISVSRCPKSTNDTPNDQEHYAVNLNIAGNRGRVYCKCGKDFISKSVLSGHILKSKNGRIFQCTLCTNKYFTHHTLKKHMHRFHKKKSYNGFGCRKCGKVFDSCNQIIIHRIKDH